MSNTPYKQVLVLRKDLNMRKGKMVAQGAHASMGAILQNSIRQETEEGGEIILKLDKGVWGWLNSRFAKICVGAKDLDELLDIEAKAKAAGLRTCLIQDAGFTEFNGVPTYTALSVGPDEVGKLDPITGHLPLL